MTKDEATASPKDAALKLALEALERYQIKRQDFDTFVDVITAIKEALALTSTQCEVQPEQEPSITKEARGTLILHSGWDDLPNGTKFYTTPPKRPWVGLTDDDYEIRVSEEWKNGMSYAEAKLEELNI